MVQQKTTKHVSALEYNLAPHPHNMLPRRCRGLPRNGPQSGRTKQTCRYINERFAPALGRLTLNHPFRHIQLWQRPYLAEPTDGVADACVESLLEVTQGAGPASPLAAPAWVDAV